MAYSWEELAGLALARQFPGVAGRDPATVGRLIGRIGPIQSQTARSTFIALAARMPGVTPHAISTAYDDLLIVRGSNLRGTVHTSAPADHPLLEVATRLGQRALWNRTLRLDSTTLGDVWHGIEEFAWSHWRTPAELKKHLVTWLETNDPRARHRLEGDAGRYFGFGHGGLLRRPLRGGWEGQGAPGYRTAAAVLGDRTAVLDAADASLDALVRRHLAAHGPASRHDLAWWSGIGLRGIDASLERLAGATTTDTGPDGRSYHGVADTDPHPGTKVWASVAGAPGVRLLPEFDALLCAYDPPARARFVTPDHYRRLWSPANGVLLAPLLVDGRLTGHWRLTGTGRTRTCEVVFFAGTHRPTRSELDEQVTALVAAHGTEVDGLRIRRE